MKANAIHAEGVDPTRPPIAGKTAIRIERTAIACRRAPGRAGPELVASERRACAWEAAKLPVRLLDAERREVGRQEGRSRSGMRPRPRPSAPSARATIRTLIERQDSGRELRAVGEADRPQRSSASWPRGRRRANSALSSKGNRLHDGLHCGAPPRASPMATQRSAYPVHVGLRARGRRLGLRLVDRAACFVALAAGGRVHDQLEDRARRGDRALLLGGADRPAGARSCPLAAVTVVLEAVTLQRHARHAPARAGRRDGRDRRVPPRRRPHPAQPAARFVGDDLRQLGAPQRALVGRDRRARASCSSRS